MNSTQAVGRISLVALVAMTFAAVPAHAAVEVNDKTDILLQVFVPCAAGGAGELVDLAGPLHTLISYTINGNNVSGYFHFQPQAVIGLGETTDEKYKATGVTQESFKTAFVNLQANDTFVNNFRIIGQKSGNNYLIHETLHLNFNANGTLTVVHDNFSATCQ
jgi:hypothetical protein